MTDPDVTRPDAATDSVVAEDPVVVATSPEAVRAVYPVTLDHIPDIRLIACDMDGTLLDDEDAVHDDFWPLIDELHERGVVFCPASGRQYYNLLERFDLIADRVVFIAENGTYVVRNGTELSSDCLEQADAQEMVRIARRINESGGDVGAVLCGKASAYIERTDQPFLDEVDKYYHRLRIVEDLTAITDDDVLKVAIYDFVSSEQVSAPAYAAFNESHQVVVSGQHWLDLMSPAANKGTGIRHIQEVLGITRDQTMVFGDFLNDLEMMDEATYSFAMANAHPDLAARASYRAPGNTDNGVVRTIKSVLGPAVSLVNEYFKPARPWVTGNLQTVAGQLRPGRYDVEGAGSEERLVVPLSDGSGDALAVRVHRPRQGAQPQLPLVLLVHGMGGTIDSPYVRAMALGLLRGGYPVARVDLRGAGDSREHTRQLYHGGRSDDLRDVLAALAQLDGFDGLAQVGWSLGGNVTLKLLGEPLDGLPLRAGATVCAPLDLLNDVEHISRRMGGVYQRALMHGLRRDTLDSNLDLTETERDQIRRARSLVEFDSLITARRNGWRDAAEYYFVNSSAQFLPRITVPTLVVHAIDDPMIPDTAYRAMDWDVLAGTTPVRRAITPHGGHCGFHERGAELPWFVGRIRRFFDETCGATGARPRSGKVAKGRA